MAGMLIPSLDPLPSGVWEGVFSVLAAWFIWRTFAVVARRFAGASDDSVRCPCLTHLVMTFAMLYMYIVPTASLMGSTSGGMVMGDTTHAGGFVGLPFLFLVALVVLGAWELNVASHATQPLSATRTASSRAHAFSGFSGPTAAIALATAQAGSASHTQLKAWPAPGLKTAAHVAMCITMAYMLVVMV